MQVPIIPVTSDSEKNLLTGEITFDGVTPRLLDGLSDYMDAVRNIVSGFEERRPVLILDVKGIQRKNINDVLLKHLKARGADIWFMTDIERVDDVLDAFNTDADLVFAPIHLISEDTDYPELTEISDSIVPTIFVRDGRAVLRKGSTYDISSLAESLYDMGSPYVCIFDTDGSLEGRWDGLSDDWIIPYSHKGPVKGTVYTLTDCPRYHRQV